MLSSYRLQVAATPEATTARRDKSCQETSCIHGVELGGQKDYLRSVRDIFVNQTKARFVYLHTYLSFSSICWGADRLTFCRIDQLAAESRNFFFFSQMKLVRKVWTFGFSCWQPSRLLIDVSYSHTGTDNRRASPQSCMIYGGPMWTRWANKCEQLAIYTKLNMGLECTYTLGGMNTLLISKQPTVWMSSSASTMTQKYRSFITTVIVHGNASSSLLKTINSVFEL
jgi:hypothetical protein